MEHIIQTVLSNDVAKIVSDYLTWSKSTVKVGDVVTAIDIDDKRIGTAEIVKISGDVYTAAFVGYVVPCAITAADILGPPILPLTHRHITMNHTNDIILHIGQRIILNDRPAEATKIRNHSFFVHTSVITYGQQIITFQFQSGEETEVTFPMIRRNGNDSPACNCYFTMKTEVLDKCTSVVVH